MTGLRGRDRSVRSPQVPQEKTQLHSRQAEDLIWHELLMAPETEQTQGVEPLRNRIAATMSQWVRRPQPQGRAACYFILVPYGRYPEVFSRNCDSSQVLLIDTRVADWLPLDERTVAEQMREHDYLLLGHLPMVYLLALGARNPLP